MESDRSSGGEREKKSRREKGRREQQLQDGRRGEQDYNYQYSSEEDREIGEGVGLLREQKKKDKYHPSLSPEFSCSGYPFYQQELREEREVRNERREKHQPPRQVSKQQKLKEQYKGIVQLVMDSYYSDDKEVQKMKIIDSLEERVILSSLYTIVAEESIVANQITDALINAAKELRSVANNKAAKEAKEAQGSWACCLSLFSCCASVPVSQYRESRLYKLIDAGLDKAWKKSLIPTKINLEQVSNPDSAVPAPPILLRPMSQQQSSSS